MRTLCLALVASGLLLSSPAWALIPTPVGGHKGELDVNLRVTLERGKVEPQLPYALHDAGHVDVAETTTGG